MRRRSGCRAKRWQCVQRPAVWDGSRMRRRAPPAARGGTGSENLLLRGQELLELRVVLELREFRFLDELLAVLEALFKRFADIQQRAIFGARLCVGLGQVV